MKKMVLKEDLTMNDENGLLKHYGILGMRWGVRRTPEQLGHRRGKRYNDDNAKKQTVTKEEMGKASRVICGVEKGDQIDPITAYSGVNANSAEQRTHGLGKYDLTSHKRAGSEKEEDPTCIGLVYEARRRGYDITSKPMNGDPFAQELFDNVGKAFIDPETGEHPTPKKLVSDVSDEEVLNYYQSPDAYKPRDHTTPIDDAGIKLMNESADLVWDTVKEGGRYLFTVKEYRIWHSPEGIMYSSVMVDCSGKKKNEYDFDNGPQVLYQDSGGKSELVSIGSWGVEQDPFDLCFDANEYIDFTDSHPLSVSVLRVDNLELDPTVFEKIAEKTNNNVKTFNHADNQNALLNHKEDLTMNDENGLLKHYGILGMRWGVRRTPEQLGRKRGSGSDDNTRKNNKPAQATGLTKGKSKDIYASAKNADSTLVYVARRLGYDAVLKKGAKNPDGSEEDLEKMFIDPKTGKQPKSKSVNWDIDPDELCKYVESGNYNPDIEKASRKFIDESVVGLLDSSVKKGGQYVITLRSVNGILGEPDNRSYVLDWTDGGRNCKIYNPKSRYSDEPYELDAGRKLGLSIVDSIFPMDNYKTGVSVLRVDNLELNAQNASTVVGTESKFSKGLKKFNEIMTTRIR